MRRTQLWMTGSLLRTTRRIHLTHSQFGRSIPDGVGVRLCFLLFVIMFCARLQTKRVDLQIFRQDVGVNGHGKQSTRHNIFSRGSFSGLGLNFGAKFSNSVMHGNCKFVTPISQKRRVLKPKGATINSNRSHPLPLLKGVTTNDSSTRFILRSLVKARSSLLP